VTATSGENIRADVLYANANNMHSRSCLGKPASTHARAFRTSLARIVNGGFALQVVDRRMPSLQSTLLNVFVRTVVKPRLFKSKPVDALRRQMRQMERFVREPADVRVTATPLPTCEVEWVVPVGLEHSDRVILYVPGGGFVMRTPKAHRILTAAIARAASARLQLVFYRLAPEYPFPCGLHDVLAAYERLLSEGISAERIVFGGDSAGGTLVLASLLALRDAGKQLPAGAFALSAATDLTAHSRGSRRTNAKLDPLMPGPGEQGIDTQMMYVGGDRGPLTEPCVSPVFGDFTGLPPLLLQVGSIEILLDDSTRLVERARAAGVDAEVEVWDEAPHVWHGLGLPESRQAVGHLADFMRRCAP
jgi:epsilon-lactone hydrolase